MCGIVGYIGAEEAYPILLKGLKRLEYRGYDSAGIATIDDEKKVILYKAQGKVANLEGKKDVLKGKIGLAHTRWATHGVPNEINSHPHFNSDKTIMLVHNGIIENYLVLKKRLIGKGYKFVSDTDSEVLVHLIDYYLKRSKEEKKGQETKEQEIKREEIFEESKGDMEKALRLTLHDVVGAYGIVVFSNLENKLYAARKGSPLVIGIGKGENFIASDPAAFLDHTRRVLYLEDEDIAIVGKDSYEIKSLCLGNGECVARKENKVDWDLSAVEKNGYDHFMLKEIMEQPQSLMNCVAGRIDKLFGDLRLSIDLSTEFVKNLKRICIVACGTSSYAALVGKYLIEKYSRIPVEVEVASEWRYKNPIVGKNDLAIFISQSGETADTLAALKEAKKLGAKTLGIINVVGSSLAREVDSGIYIHAGPEIGVASTKAFTGQVLCMNFLATKLAQMRGDIDQEKVRSIVCELEKVGSYVQEIFEESRINEIKKAANAIKDAKSVFFLGRGANVASAKEGAIKLKEISYIHAEDFPAGEMKHGPIALLEKGFPIVAFVNKDDLLAEKNLSSIQEAKARGAKVIVVADHIDSTLESYADHILLVPKVPDFLHALINVVPLQFLAYYTAKIRGCEIDQPRNLAKSVTVE